MSEVRRAAPRHTAEAYAAAEPFLFLLGKHYRAGRISGQQAKTLKGVALAGNVEGAEKGLRKLIFKGGADACGN